MLPSFFTDSSDSMKFEEVIDFFMSWTIRCADDKNRTVAPLVHNNSKAILAKLIGVEEYDELEFTDIEVWKQHRHIDLWCEFKLNNQPHALIIETKMYSTFRKDQLKSYKDLEEQGLLVKLPDDLNRVLYQVNYRWTQCTEYGEENNKCEILRK